MRYVFDRALLPCVVATGLLLDGQSLRAQPSFLSFDAALRVAGARSSQLVAERDSADAARDMGVAVGQRPDPVLISGLENVPVTSADAFSLTRDFMTMRSIGFSRELTRDSKREARAAQFERAAAAADAAGTVALSALQRGTAMAWLERYYREQAHTLLLQQREPMALQVTAADAAVRGGGAQTDALAARLAVARLDDRAAAAARDVEVAKVKLARWVGDDARLPLGPPPPMNDVALHGGDLDEALAHHPELALMARREEVARAEAEVARANKRSDWTVQVTYSQRGPAFSNMMSVSVSKPLQLHERQRQDREWSAKLAVADRARAEREEATREHLAEAASLLAAWNGNRARLARYTEELEPLAERRTQAATAAYRAGTATLNAVLDARVANADVRLERLMLEMETASLWAELHFLVPAEIPNE